VPTFFHVLLTRLRTLFGLRDHERDFDDELEVHLAMAEERKIHNGMTPREARRTARLELGGLTQLREAGRETRGLPGLDICWLDMKLGVRTMIRYWRLTVVGGLAMTVAFAIAGMVFAVMNQFVEPTLPFEEGDRIVALQIWHTEAQRSQEIRNEDFARWRGPRRSVEDVSAFRNVLRSLRIDNGPTETVSVAEMSASGFDVVRVPPLRGRVFTEADSRSGAKPVVVIGYDVWRTRFSFDPAAVGKLLRLDGTPHAIVGIMPEDFAFPVNHSYWVPLQPPPFGNTEDTEAGLFVFARLAAGAMMESAQLELETLGLLAAGAGPETTQRLRPQVIPYTHAFNDPNTWVVRLVQFLVGLVLIPPCANVAILMYARVIARQEEFSARYALGAGRGRIIWQLFVETFVLTAAAAGIAFGVVVLAYEYMRSRLAPVRPFWMWRNSSSFEVALYLAALAVAAALIVGVLPALHSTGRLLQPGLQSLGSRSRIRLGYVWTTLVIVQVAICVAVLPSAVDGVSYIRTHVQIPGFAHEVLTARVRMDRAPGDFAARFGSAEAELIRRLRTAPGVRAATIGLIAPDSGGSRGVIEIEAGGERRSVSVNNVDEDFFDIFNIRILSGRGFEAADFTPNSDVVIISHSVAEEIAGEVLGRRLRHVISPEPDRWYEIVGVVESDAANPDRQLYHPALLGRVHPSYLALDVGSDPARASARILEIAGSVDPALRVDEFASLDSLIRRRHTAQYLLAGAIAVMTFSVVFLSGAGIHALMSVILSQRRREIGIRLALGAPQYQLVKDIFLRASFGLAAGSAGGVLFALLIRRNLPDGWVELQLPGVIPLTAAVMILIGLLAAFGPVRRALSVDPNETLRDA
jgi:putative ABC transport system permease protein